MNVSPEFLAALPPEVQEEVCFNFFTTRPNIFLSVFVGAETSLLPFVIETLSSNPDPRTG